MNILVDAMGGDNAPEEIIKGCSQAANIVSDFKLILLGKEKAIEDCLLNYKIDENRYTIVNCDEVVGNDDKPTKVVKNKKRSSMIVGLNMLKEKKGDVFISAGNTGAVLAGSLLILKRIDGVDRPALTTFIPTKKGSMLLLDVGSNTMCRPVNYLQFATMGSLYIKDVFNVKKPKIGLINIGEEEEKGTDVVKQAYSLLSKSNLNFVGNIEGRPLLDGNVDVAVCDGFVGNVVLKLLEGAADFFMGEIKEIYKTNVLTMMSTYFVKGGFKRLKKKLDYEEYGGVPLLGVNGKVMKCHGSSTSVTIKNTIFNSIKFGRCSIIDQIKDEFKYLEVENIG
ncbi:MAG: phosphate acyltransferase PlsX [Clostridiales bacterium]